MRSTGSVGLLLLDLAPPADQEGEFRAIGLVVLLVVLAEEHANAADSLVDLPEGPGEISPGQCLEADRPRPHHVHVGSVLVKLDLVALARRVLNDERKQPKVTLGVSRHQIILLEVKGGEVAVIVLKPLAHQIAAGAVIESELLARGQRTFLARFVEVEERFKSVRFLAVRPSGQLHLKDSQVDPHLDSFPAVITSDNANLKFVGIEVPAGKNGGDVLTHAIPPEMRTAFWTRPRH